MHVHRIDSAAHDALHASVPHGSAVRRQDAQPTAAQRLRDVILAGTAGEQLQSLTQQLSRVPDVRFDVVNAVRERLDRGEYVSRHAAERTAAAIQGTES